MVVSEAGVGPLGPASHVDEYEMVAGIDLEAETPEYSRRSRED
jgi:hypothetical protein